MTPPTKAAQSAFENWKQRNIIVKDGDILTLTEKWHKLFSGQISIDTLENCWDTSRTQLLSEVMAMLSEERPVRENRYTMYANNTDCVNAGYNDALKEIRQKLAELMEQNGGGV